MLNGLKLHTRRATAHHHPKDEDTLPRLYPPDTIAMAAAAEEVAAKIEIFLDLEALLLEDDTPIPEAHHHQEEEGHTITVTGTGDVNDQFLPEMIEEVAI